MSPPLSRYLVMSVPRNPSPFRIPPPLATAWRGFVDAHWDTPAVLHWVDPSRGPQRRAGGRGCIQRHHCPPGHVLAQPPPLSQQWGHLQAHGGTGHRAACVAAGGQRAPGAAGACVSVVLLFVAGVGGVSCRGGHHGNSARFKFVLRACAYGCVNVRLCAGVCVYV